MTPCTAAVVLDHPYAKLPVKGTPGSAGFDIHSVEDVVLYPGEQRLIDTGLRIACPEGTYPRVAPRSGLARQCLIDVHAGVVDPDYTGKIGVLLYHHGDNPLYIEVGERIAQIIFERFATPELVPVASLPDTERGSGGYGSTGGRA